MHCLLSIFISGQNGDKPGHRVMNTKKTGYTRLRLNVCSSYLLKRN